MAEKIKQLVRLVDIDVNGDDSIYLALKKVKGVSFSLANAICNVLKLNKFESISSLEESKLEEVKDCIKNPGKYGVPTWLFNRRKDPESGDDKHLVSSELDFTKSMDIRMMKKMKSYKGVRHSLGLPVRGQRTKAHFRKGKALGVKRKKK